MGTELKVNGKVIPFVYNIEIVEKDEQNALKSTIKFFRIADVKTDSEGFLFEYEIINLLCGSIDSVELNVTDNNSVKIYNFSNVVLSHSAWTFNLNDDKYLTSNGLVDLHAGASQILKFTGDLVFSNEVLSKFIIENE